MFFFNPILCSSICLLKKFVLNSGYTLIYIYIYIYIALIVFCFLIDLSVSVYSHLFIYLHFWSGISKGPLWF